MSPELFPQAARLTDARTGQSWAQVDICDQATRRSEVLKRIGVGRSCVCIIATLYAADALFWLFGVWNLGGVAVLINPGVSEFERTNIIETTSAQVWIDERGPHLLTSFSTGEPGVHSALDDPALVLMTSGTTGVPKGIVHTRRGLQARVDLNVAYIGANAMRTSLCVLPVFFGHGLIGNCLTPLLAGGHLVLWASPSPAEIAGFSDILERYRITFMSSVPTFWKMAVRMSKKIDNELERVHVGSAPLSIKQWERIADWCGTRNVWNLFGMTETANWIGGGALDDSKARDGYVGTIWGGRYAISDDHGAVRATGRGEVLVQTPTIMTGYFKQPEASAEAFQGEWFQTGDIGELDKEGALSLVGRTKFEINRGGLKVQAEEIDMMLERHPSVMEACAFGIPDRAAGEAVAAAIVVSPKAGARFESAEVVQWCRTQVRAEAVPAKLFVVDAIARNERGKIQRGKVRDQLVGAERD
ncbi:MAG: class I adenylate-forming enzyme family protein [Pseudomonadota bacterium]